MQALVLLPDWDCRACTVAQKLARGCEAPARQRLELDGVVVERCPRRPLLDNPRWLNEVFWLYSNWSKGILPDGSTLHTNPALLTEAIRAIDDAMHEAKIERDQREQRRLAMRQQMQAAMGGHNGLQPVER